MIVNIEYLQHRCYALAFQGKRRLVILLLLETQCGTKRGLLISVTVWSSLPQWEKSHGTSFWRPYRSPQWHYCFLRILRKRRLVSCHPSYIGNQVSVAPRGPSSSPRLSHKQVFLVSVRDKLINSWKTSHGMSLSWCGQQLHLRVFAHTGPRTLSRGQGGRFCDKWLCLLIVGGGEGCCEHDKRKKKNDNRLHWLMVGLVMPWRGRIWSLPAGASVTLPLSNKGLRFHQHHNYVCISGK